MRGKKTVDSLFENFHEDYYGDQNFDYYNAELLRAADFLLLSHSAFLSNKGYWSGVANDPAATAIRRETAGLFSSIEKLVISDTLTSAELAPWANTRIIKRADAYREIAALKQQPGRDILVIMSRLLWNDLLVHDLVDELHLNDLPDDRRRGRTIVRRSPISVAQAYAYTHLARFGELAGLL